MFKPVKVTLDALKLKYSIDVFLAFTSYIVQTDNNRNKRGTPCLSLHGSEIIRAFTKEHP
jgi:hypothetical protein